MDGKEHASAMFAKARVTYVCIDKRLAKNPSLLRCDLNSYPMVCADEGHMVFSRSAQGEVYAGLLPEEKRLRKVSVPGLQGSSRLSVSFRPNPPDRSTFEEKDTTWQFMVPAQDSLPAGFTLVKGALCDRAVSALNDGKCFLHARSASLHWYIEVALPGNRGTPLTAAQYRAALAFWLPLLDKFVEDPAMKQ